MLTAPIAASGATSLPKKPHREQPPRRRTRRRVVGACIALFLVVIVLATVYVAHRALVAKAALEDAQQQLTSFRSQVGQPGAPSTAALYERIQGDTSRAVDQTDDRVWWTMEHVPVAGRNLVAFRQTAALLDTLVRDGIGPVAQAADGLSVDSIKVEGGGVDLEPVRKLTPAVISLDDATQRAVASAAAVDTVHVVPQLTTQVDKLRLLLSEAAPRIHDAREWISVIGPALGSEGPRHYLLIFQNNAEERASGGNPAAMAMLQVTDGKVTLGKQASSREFPRPYKRSPFTPGGPRNADWYTIYGKYTSRYLTNITMTPDFPSTAAMARAMWRKEFGGVVNGVVSVDPVALSHLLRITGPVKLADGRSISSTNAVSYLLYDVYADYPDPGTQDEIFASVTKAVFSGLTKGKGDPRAYLAALKPMVREQRLKLWSAHRHEERLVRSTSVGNMLPADNREATVLGVYNNDDSTSKMSYFMDERVSVKANACQGKPKYTVTATVLNTLPASRVSSLPEYVKPHQVGIPPGGDRQWVQLYGPVGGELVDVRIDGVKVRWGTSVRWQLNTNQKATGAAGLRPAVKGTMYDRPVGVVSITLGPASSKTVTAEFVGHADDSPTVKVSHTPKVRAVPVTIAPTRCGG